MDITSQNFEEKLQFMLASVRSADFITLDTEFSGLSVGYEDQTHQFDQVEDRYQKLRHNCLRMNAFQVGICCFKWDEDKQLYSSRPINCYVFPHSEMTGTKTLQFKASNIRFLIKNNFDFNKLFTLGVNYQRLSDKETILKKSGDAQQFTSRQYTKLGSTSQALLDSYIRKVHNFFSLQKKTTDLLVLELDIESYALRRRLQQVLQGIYRNKGGIYTNFQRTAPKFVVKLLQPKEQEESKIQAKVVKVTEEQCCVSEYDRVIKGDHNNEVYFEDDVCIAFQNEDKAAKQHFTVLAKKNTIQSAGRLLLVAKEVALQLGMTEGYRIVMDQSVNSRHTESSNNLAMHVIGGEQLIWPPLTASEPKKESEEKPQSLYDVTMGFTLVIEEIIKAKKPLIGHNCMYDWMYVYNQFIAELPETFAEFSKHWNECFPLTFDNKVLAYNSKAFSKTSLGEVFDKCQNDGKLKDNLKFQFDLKNGCVNYEGTAMLSHYHEAAYDAHMTGVAFAHILKLKEDKVKPNKPVQWDKGYPLKFINQMMLDSFGSQRVYFFQAPQHQKYLQEAASEFADTIHVTFEKDFAKDISAETIASMFHQYGDFQVQKDTVNSCFMDFAFIDSQHVPDRKLSSVMGLISKHPNVAKVCVYRDAPKFKAHSNCDYQ